MGMGGKLEDSAAAAVPGTDVAALLASDQFRPFRADSFDPASFASRSLAEGGGTTAQAQTEALQAGVAALDGALRGLVLRHQGELLAQAGRLADGEAAVQRITLSVRSLQMVAARVRAEVAEPYAQIAARTQQLANLQASVDLLRHAIHRLKLVQKLRAQMGGVEGAGECRAPAVLGRGQGPRGPSTWGGRAGGGRFRSPSCCDAKHLPLHTPPRLDPPPTSTPTGSGGILEVAKAAKLLSEIAAVDAEADLSGVEAVEADAEFLATAAAVVRSQTEVRVRCGCGAVCSVRVRHAGPRAAWPGLG